MSGLRRRLRGLCYLLALGLVVACGQKDSDPTSSPTDEAARSDSTPATTATPPPAASAEDVGLTPMLDLETEQFLKLSEPWRGDFGEIATGKRRFIRALVPYSKTMYFLAEAEQQGIAFEALREFERVLAKASPKGSVPPKIVIVPTSRDRLLPALAEGLGDISVAGLTVTPEREKVVAFSNPTLDDVREVVVTGPGAPSITSIDDLAGREIHIRKSSTYWETLEGVNADLKKKGRLPVKIVPAEELLETEDLLQMVDAGILPATVADLHIAKAWTSIYTGMTVQDGVPLRTGGHLAWAVRKDAPELLTVVNDFVKNHRQGTVFGNVLLKRYLDPAARLRNPTTQEEARKFREVVEFMQRYAKQYDFDWLLITAQAYQESQLDNSRRSAAGAMGIMQVKPATAGDMGIPDIRGMNHNIEAGVKYLRFMSDRYFADEGIDARNRHLFAIASYNAGPAKVARLRKEASERGLDPNRWFQNVEIVAARRIGRETVDYVSNIFKYYVAYKAILAAEQAHEGTVAAAP